MGGTKQGDQDEVKADPTHHRRYDRWCGAGVTRTGSSSYPRVRRALERAELVEGLGRVDSETGGRPAELFRFRREILNARPVSGLSLPLLRD